MGVSCKVAEVRMVTVSNEISVSGATVPVGYKQTEVGLIPEDWEVQRLGENASFRTGPFGSALHKSDYIDDGVPIVNPMHIVDGKIEPTRTMSTTEQAAKGLSVFQLKPGDIVIGRRGDMGRCAMVLEHQSGWLCGTGSMIIRPLGFDAGFLQRVLSSRRVISDIEDASVGTTMVNLNQSTLYTLNVQMPPVPEQCAIASALSDMDALLDGLDRLIAKKRDLKQAAMQQLLTGQTRLPGFKGEWEARMLSSITDIRSGGTPSTLSPSFWNGGVPWCTPTDITSLKVGKYLSITERTISNAGLKASSAELIPPGSIIMTTRATIGECAINRATMTTNQGFKNLIPTGINGEFLYYLMTVQKSRLIQLCAGSTFLEIGKKKLEGFELYVPNDQDEQKAIATFLSDMDVEIQALMQRRSKSAALKQAMMQELLTGKTRLVKPSPQESQRDNKQASERKANVYFLRSVLAAEIIDQLYEEPTFGHVKFEKVLFLVEHLCEVGTGSTYHRDAAGPYDNRALRSIDSQLRKQQWFDAQKEGGRYRYVPLNQQGGHKTYFDRYFSSISANLMAVVETCRALDTERCEIVATLFSAWSDLLRDKGTVSDEMIVHEVLNNWHKSKKRIAEDRWMAALGWMRDQGFVPRRLPST